MLLHTRVIPIERNFTLLRGILYREGLGLVLGDGIWSSRASIFGIKAGGSFLLVLKLKEYSKKEIWI